MDLEDFELEDTEKLMTEKKKKKNSGDKGNRHERGLCKIFEKRFNKPFIRAVGSGNRWGQVTQMSEAAKETLSGDISIPAGFKFVLESKGGYEKELDLHGCFVKGCRKLDEFLKQVTDDHKRCGRKPLLCWKRSRKPWYGFVWTKEIEDHLDKFEYRLIYRNWSCVDLNKLLELDDEFFFE